MINHGLLGSKRLDGGANPESQRLGSSQALLRPLQLALPGLEAFKRVLGLLELFLSSQQHLPSLFNLPSCRPNGLNVLDSPLGQIEDVLDLRLDRLDTSLPCQSLLQGLAGLRLSRLPPA